MALRSHNSVFTHARLGVLNVLDYGATGDDATDDAAAIQRAIDSLPSVGGRIMFPAAAGGTFARYVLGSTVTLRKGVSLVGASPLSSTIVVNAAVGFAYSPVSLEDSHLVISDLSFEGTTSAKALHLIGVQHAAVERCVFSTMHTGVHAAVCARFSVRDSQFTTVIANAGVQLDSCGQVILDRLAFESNDAAGAGVLIDNSNTVAVRACLFKDVVYGLVLVEARETSIEACDFQSIPNNAILAQTTASHRLRIQQCAFDVAGTRVLEFSAGSLAHSAIVVEGNHFTMGASQYAFAPGSTSAYRFAQNGKTAGTFVEGSSAGTVTLDVA